MEAKLYQKENKDPRHDYKKKQHPFFVQKCHFPDLLKGHIKGMVTDNFDTGFIASGFEEVLVSWQKSGEGSIKIKCVVKVL